MQDCDEDEFDAEVQAITENAGQLRSIQGQGDNNLESWTLDELADYLRTNPISLMAQNVAQEVFESEDKKVEFENLFRNFCESSPNEVTFNYLKSFRRVRVNFPVGFEAICAKVDLHQSQICGSETNVYLADQPLPNMNEPDFLEVPQSDKMFLVSPPPSPPVGWEACYEDPPHPAPELDLSAMKISSSPSSSRKMVSATSIAAARGGAYANPVAFEPQSANINTTSSSSSSHPNLDTMLLLTAFAHHCSQPGQVVEILPEDDGNPSIFVTSVDGPSSRSDSRPGGPIPRSPCPPYATWPAGEGDEEDEGEERPLFAQPTGDDIPVYSDSDGENEPVESSGVKQRMSPNGDV